MYRKYKEMKAKGHDADVMSDDVDAANRVVCCIKHKTEFVMTVGGICPECMADHWAICSTDLEDAKDRVRVLKAGLTKDFPKRLEDLYIEQKDIRFVGDRARCRVVQKGS